MRGRCASPGACGAKPPVRARQNGVVTADELTAVFMGMGERLNEEEMDELLGWLGLRDGGEVNLAAFKKLPCWFEGSSEFDTLQVNVERLSRAGAHNGDQGSSGSTTGRLGMLGRRGGSSTGEPAGMVRHEDIEAYAKSDC